MPWPASMKTTKQLINQIFAASKNREFHQAYQANVSQFWFESAPRRTTFIAPPPILDEAEAASSGAASNESSSEMTSYDCPCGVALPFVFEEGSNHG